MAEAPHRPFRASILEKPWRWLDERYHLDDVVDFVRHKEIPIGGHAVIWYYFGGIALFFFTVQIVTGILLLMYYEAGENTSYESMKFLVGKVPFGWLIRSIHCWSAHLMVIAVLVHMFSVFFLRSYRKPRELTWMTGFGLLGLVLTFGFSGYLLPWNELSYFATAVGTDSMKSIPYVGEWLLEVLRGGKEVSIRTLHRFFALHVCALPIATFGLVAFHMVLVQRQGMAAPEVHDNTAASRLGAMRFFPNFAMRDALLWVLCMNILAILAVWLPHGPGIPGMEWNIGDKADPLKPAYPGIKPEWYFLWVYQMLKEFPAHILGMEGPQACMFIASLLMAAWLLVPVLNRSSQRGRKSPAFEDFGVAVVLFLAFLTLKAWDLGVHVPHGEDPAAKPELVQIINRNSAGVIMLLGLGITILRRMWYGASHFAFTAIALLQAILHGFVGLSYLAASGACTLLFGVAVVFHARRARRERLAAACLLGCLLLSRPSAAQEPQAAAQAGNQMPVEKWPEDFRKLFDANENGKPIVPPEAHAFFRRLPGHAQTLFFSGVESGLLSSPVQLASLLSLELDDRKIELLLSDNCVLCHTNPDMQSDETLFRLRDGDPAGREKDPYRHLDVREIVSDVHFRQGLMCAGCHGGTSTGTEMDDEIYARWPEASKRKADRTWVPEFCTVRCHANAEFMQRFNPSLPVDQMLKYRESHHGQLLLGKKDSKAAQCVSCHGVHGIRSPESPVSSVNAANIPATCGKCHADPQYMSGYTLRDGTTPIPTDQLEKYRKSVHGLALLQKHDMGAPACNDCHGNHAALPPEVGHIAQVCRTCHVVNGTLFDGSPHKKAFVAHRWPECETCHGKHDIKKTNDEMLAVAQPTSICDPCHRDYGKPLCTETTALFYNSITQVREAGEEVERAAGELAELGLEVDDLRFGVSGLRDSLLQSRSLIHSFSRTDFAKPYEAGMKTAAELRTEVERMRGEYSFRRNWLIVSTLFITLFAVLLYMRIRLADKQGGYRPPGAA